MDRIPMKVSDQIILHLLNFGGYSEKYKVPFQVSQAGIANILGAHRSHISYYLKKLEAQGILTSRLGRIQGLPRKRKVYFLTKRGEKQGEEIVHGLRRTGLTLPMSGREVKIDFDEDSFANHKSSFLEKVLDKVERETTDGEGYEGSPNYILDMPGKPLHESYLSVLSKWNLKRVEKTIDRSQVAVFTSKNAPEVLYTYLTALAQELSKVCNVFVYDLHPLSSRTEFIVRFSRFLGRTGNFALEGLMDHTEDKDFWNDVARITRGLPFVIIIRGEWYAGCKKSMKKTILQMTDMEIPLITGGDDAEVSRWLKKKGVNLNAKHLSKSTAGEIYESIAESGHGPLGEKARKRLLKEASEHPLLLHAFGKREAGSSLDELVPTGESFYKAGMNALPEESRTVLVGLSGGGYPLIRDQLDEGLAEQMAQLEDVMLVTSTAEGFIHPPGLIRFVREGFSESDKKSQTLELYERLLFQTREQAMVSIDIYLERDDTVKGLGLAVDWFSLTAEMTGPPMLPVIPELNEKKLSRESLALLRTLEGYGELHGKDLKKAWKLAQLAADSGEKLKNESVLARASYLKGRIHLSKGEKRRALEKMVTAFNLFMGAGNAMGTSLSALTVAILFEEREEPNKALAYIDMALAGDKAMGSAALISMVHAKKGDLYNMKNIFSKATISFGEAFDMATKVGCKAEALGYELKRGDVLVKDGHQKEAAAVYEKVVEEAEELGLGLLQLEAYERLSEKCFPNSSTKHARYKAKAGHIRVLLKGATRMTRSR